MREKCRNPGSNQGPPDLQSGALPTELVIRNQEILEIRALGVNSKPRRVVQLREDTSVPCVLKRPTAKPGSVNSGPQTDLRSNEGLANAADAATLGSGRQRRSRLPVAGSSHENKNAPARKKTEEDSG